jgi:hypothetical protein
MGVVLWGEIHVRNEWLRTLIPIERQDLVSSSINASAAEFTQ